MNKHVKIPMAAVVEIKRLQWQIEQAFMDLEKVFTLQKDTL